MKIMKNKRIVYPVIAGVLVCMVVLAGWFIVQGQAKPPIASGNVELLAPSYDSIEELTSASDTVVVGTVKGVFSHLTSYGKPEEKHTTGIPYVLYEVNVDEVLKGEVGNTIFICELDPEQLSSESISALEANEQVTLFLQERMSKEWSYIDWPSDKFYVTSSLDNSIFDIMPDGSVKSRAPESFTTTGCSSCGTTGEEPVFTLEEIRAKVQTTS